MFLENTFFSTFIIILITVTTNECLFCTILSILLALTSSSWSPCEVETNVIDLKIQFLTKGNQGFFSETAPSRSRVRTVQNELGISHHTRKQGSYQRLPGLNQKDPGANMRRLSLAKNRTI